MTRLSDNGFLFAAFISLGHYILRCFCLIGISIFSSCLYAGLSTDCFNWNNWMTLTENGKQLKIKFTEESVFKEAGTVNVTIERVSSDSPSEDLHFAFQLNQLPAVHSGSFTEEGKVASEIPPLLAVAYALLFLQDLDSQTGEPVNSDETRSLFVQRSQLVMFTSASQNGMNIFDPEESQIRLDSHTEIAISLFNIGGNSAIFNAEFSLIFRKKNILQKIIYELDSTSQDIPFLTENMVIKLHKYFKMDTSVASEAEDQPRSRLNTFGKPIEELPDFSSPSPVLLPNSLSQISGPQITSGDVEIKVKRSRCPFKCCLPKRKNYYDFSEGI